MPDTGKTDMERLGIFQEMGYTTIGDKYKLPKMNFNDAAGKGKQMLPGGSKTRTARQDGYFDKAFNRVMEAEAYSDPIKLRRQNRLKEAKKNLGKPFLPSNGDKKPSGLGNAYGTFAGPVGAFSPVARPRKAYVTPGKNVLTNPPKNGTGYGYPNVTLGKSAPYAPDPFERAKDIRNVAGMKAGTFDPYPSHSNDPYVVKQKRAVTTNKEGKIFHPSPGPKTAPTNSVMESNVIKRLNTSNYRQLAAQGYTSFPSMMQTRMQTAPGVITSAA
ncbi:cilia-and flagella-associated protein 96-like isoform X2 [Branchiostoma lanceolatum]|uniref:cilia-and flagella-associated protein 96-like isoform X2 n=1 Tax=Branchiostoma lanceolatum TaxID=7740 RepID=UPI00113310B9